MAIVASIELHAAVHPALLDSLEPGVGDNNLLNIKNFHPLVKSRPAGANP